MIYATFLTVKTNLLKKYIEALIFVLIKEINF